MSTIDWQKKARELTLRVRNFVDGKYLEDHENGFSSTICYSKLSPRDGSLIYRLGPGEQAEVNHAVESAKDAFNDGRWRNLSIIGRKSVLFKLADLVEENKEELALYECLDVGKPISNALTDDISRTCSALVKSAAGASHLYGPSMTDGATLGLQVRQPVGVVGGIIGWNFPLALAATKVGPALAMGNSLVLKPSESSSLSASRLAELAVQAGVPPGVFNVIHGVGETVGASLARHTDVDLLTFTGSSAIGKEVLVASGQSNMKRVILECGGKSPYIVFDDCIEDLDSIAADIVDMAFPNQGALCVSGSRLLIQESLKDKLLPKILDLATMIKPGDPLNADTRFGAIINSNHLERTLEYIKRGELEGAKCLLGGRKVNLGGECQDGYYLEPTIFDGVRPKHSIAQEEIFGPVLSILTFKDEADAVRIANSTCYGLAAYVSTTNLARSMRMTQHLNVGKVVIMGTSVPSESNIGFGLEGHKQSGIGHEGGLLGLSAYTLNTAAYFLG